MELPFTAAAWLLPLVTPICLYVAFTDMREMRITNQSVIVLALVFVVVGPLLLSWDVYLWQLAHLPIFLVIGILLNAAGTMGAGDAKFIAAASPYIFLPDWRLLFALFAATLLAAFLAHRIAKHSPLRRVAPHWESWDQGKKFPMGLALGITLIGYLALGVYSGL